MPLPITNKQIEILAPVGSFESLQAAINAGANSIYFGVEQLNMRTRSSKSFEIEDIKTISSICKLNGLYILSIPVNDVQQSKLVAASCPVSIIHVI